MVACSAQRLLSVPPTGAASGGSRLLLPFNAWHPLLQGEGRGEVIGRNGSPIPAIPPCSAIAQLATSQLADHEWMDEYTASLEQRLQPPVASPQVIEPDRRVNQPHQFVPLSWGISSSFTMHL